MQKRGMSLNILIIHNPVAGRPLISRWRVRKLRLLQELLRERGHAVEMVLTEQAGDAELLAREVKSQDVIVAAGGDGTINEIVNGLCQREAVTKAPSIAVLPLGTANVLAWELGLPSDFRKVVKLIEGGKEKIVYPGVANDRRFILMASSGLDSRVVSSVKPGLKRLLGPSAYIVAAFSAIRQNPPMIRVSVNGQRLVANTVIVTRAGRYGGPFVIAPDADLGADDLYVILLPLYGLCAAFIYGISLAFNRLHKSRDVTFIKAKEIQFENARDCKLQMDGDGPFDLPVSVSVDHIPVSILVS